ncbi:ABC transporter substrate-binding protein [Kitasatospora viridis]|uniref:Iron complex transport system substrate-binding protein n=1 Tax=Kitasatospora viridis TaxID=281105 RepID=A0A561T5Z6_9ACTN|nr:ABC transporter substrate-binding protein [Kitasatospora viridis]TWF82535.1 iron complex transport system substrate-binding protein [Kitasatospora viridis]
MRPRVLSGRSATAAVLAVVAVLATGCGGGAGGGSAEPAAAPAASAAGYPVTVTDCAGAGTTFTGPPRRIVTSNASSLEMLLELGVGDRVVGTGFPPGKGTMPAQFADQAARVPVLGQAVIPKEKLLGSGADLYIDTFAHVAGMGAMGDVPTDQEFAAAGIRHVYLKSTACATQLKGPQQDLSTVEADIRNLGAVTGSSAKAGELIAGMEQTVGQVRTALKGVAADQRPSYFFFDFDAGTKQPNAVCDKQVANAVITLAGARNVFGDCDGAFKPVSWEQVVAANPDWIQLGVRDKGSAAANQQAFDAAEQFLKDFPATKGLAAVQQGHFVRITSELTTIAGVRDADTVRRIAAVIHPDLVKG